MVATVGSISIDLSTNSVKFAQGFKGAAATVERESSRMAKAVGGVERSMASIGGTLKNFGAGIVAGAGLASLSGIIGGVRDAINELDDIADRAKTSGLGTDLFQSMSISAKQAGVDVESLNSSLQFFAKGVGLAEQGTGRLFSGLEKLNPELLSNILRTKDQEERLKLVADAMDRTSDAAQRAALSQAAFGDVDFSRVLEGGSNAIETTLELAKAQGQLFTPEQIERNKAYADALDRVDKTASVTGTSLLIELAPAFIAVLEAAEAGTQGVINYLNEMEKIGKAAEAGNWTDFLLGEKGGGGISGFFRDLVAESEDSFDSVNADIEETRAELAKLKAEGAEGIDIEVRRANAHLNELIATLGRTAAAAANVGGAISSAVARVAVGGAGQGTLPTVTRRDILTPEQRLDEVKNPTTPTGPTLKTVNVKDFLSGGRAAGGPVSPGGWYPVGERGPELLHMGASGGSVTSNASIDDIVTATEDTAEKVETANQYLQTIEDNERAMLASLEAIQSKIGSLQPSYSGGGGDALGGAVGGVGGGTTMGSGLKRGRGPSTSELEEAIRYRMSPYHAYPGPISFASGGAIKSGDSQHVEFYKNPAESVEVLKPGQRSRYGGASVGDIHIHVTGDIGSRQSQLAMRDELHRAVSQAMSRP